MASNAWNPNLSTRASNIAVIASTGINTLNSINMRSIASQVALATEQQTKQITSAFAESLNKQVYRNRRGGMAAIHRTAGYKAQDAALASYMAQHGGGASGYRSKASRPWDRDSGGKMVAALSDPNVMFRASWDGLEYVNMSAFSRKAKQWYRLNFGAKGRMGSKYKAKGDSKTYMMSFFGAGNASGSVGPFSFKGFDPSQAFTIPKGFFVNSEGSPVALGEGRGQEYVPLAYKGIELKSDFKNRNAQGKRLVMNRRALASGIAGSHFLDDGLQAITTYLPVGYTELMGQWFNEAAAGMKSSPISMVGITPGEARKHAAAIERQLLAYSRAGLRK